MRQTACDACRKTHPDTEPLGWFLVGIVELPTSPEAKSSMSFLEAIGARTNKVHELRTFTFCSAACLMAFAELEAVTPDK